MDILNSFSKPEQTDYYSSLQQYNMNPIKYFMDVIYDDPSYPPDPNYKVYTHEAVPSMNPDNNRSAMGVIMNCIVKGLVPTPTYKGSGPQEQFMYAVLVPAPILSDPSNQGAGSHGLFTWSEPNHWIPPGDGTGGGGGGGGGNFTTVYNTTTGATATQYYSLNGTLTTRAGEVFETGSALINAALSQVSLVLKKTGSPTGTATLVIRKSDDSIAATIGTIDVTTITTTDALYTFTNTSNTYKIAVGDKLLLEYTGGDASNFISLIITDADAFDGTKTHSARFV
jgi:hypothetical protein